MAKVTRRDFLRFSAVGLGSVMFVHCDYDARVPASVPPSTGYLEPCVRLPLVRLSTLADGVPYNFDYPLAGLPSFLVKLGAPADGGVGPDGDIVAFSYLCTHMGCPMKGGYNHTHKVLGPCGCHFTTFSLRHRGRIVLGQATEPLAQITLEIEDDYLFASGITGTIFGELSERCGEASA